jgi:hypothetical protein
MKKLKIINASARLENAGIVVPHGESVLSEKDFEKFCGVGKLDGNSLIALCLRVGTIRAVPIGPEPIDINALSTPDEIATALATIDDAKILKEILIKAHESPALWRQRVLTYRRMAELGTSPRWSAGEIATLDQKCPHRCGDSYRDPFQPTGNCPPDEGTNRLVRRETKLAEIRVRHRAEIAELDLC